MLRELFGGLLVAFGLYSALPLPQVEWKKNTMRYALGFLPLIGLLVGACEYGWLALAQNWQLNAMLYAAGAVLLPLAITGGIHLDGFVDTCDALCSYGDKEKKLEILKDPHVGAFGILWIIVLLLMQFGLFAQLYEAPRAAGLLLAGYALARAFGGGMIVTQTCAKDSGLARLFADNADKKQVSYVMAGWIAACVCWLLVMGKGFGIAAFVLVLLYFVYHVRLCYKQFGGITGDLCGMCITMIETLVLLVTVIGGLCLR
ncbi:MAG: adenosylcobinamide-GDP ribazoletransferase [Eubacteriales bacterium]|nr:adenosylcobinamide-GDP ribazoletransferase [Eubacteriales bacterium]